MADVQPGRYDAKIKATQPHLHKEAKGEKGDKVSCQLRGKMKKYFFGATYSMCNIILIKTFKIVRIICTHGVCIRNTPYLLP